MSLTLVGITSFNLFLVAITLLKKNHHGLCTAFECVNVSKFYCVIVGNIRSQYTNCFTNILYITYIELGDLLPRFLSYECLGFIKTPLKVDASFFDTFILCLIILQCA